MLNSCKKRFHTRLGLFAQKEKKQKKMKLGFYFILNSIESLKTE